MNIYICDDDRDFVEQMREIIETLAPHDSIQAFLSGFSLIDHVLETAEKIDVLFIDMMMPHMNGLDTGHELRKIYPNMAVVVATDHPQYAVQSFSIFPCHFMVKPITQEAVRECLERAKRLAAEEKIMLKFKDRMKFVPLYAITSIESKGFYSVFSLEDDTFTVCQPLDYYEKQLCGKGFFRVNRNTIINLRLVAEFKDDSVHMENGSNFNISRRRKNGFMNALIKMRRNYA